MSNIGLSSSEKYHNVLINAVIQTLQQDQIVNYGNPGCSYTSLYALYSAAIYDVTIYKLRGTIDRETVSSL